MPAKNGRNVALTDEQNALVDRLVRSGRYASASEVVRDGLRLLQREDEAQQLDQWLFAGLTPQALEKIPGDTLERARESIRAKVRAGLAEARRGEFVDGEKLFARWKRRLTAGTASKTTKTRVKRRG